MNDNVDAIVGLVGLFVFALILLLIGPILTVLFAALGGLIVQLTFGQWVVDGLALLGVHVPVDAVWKLSVALAFVGGYFKAVLHNPKK